MSQQSSSTKAVALGGTVFAATMMIVIGLFQAIEGVAAIVRGNFFVVAPNYLYEFNTGAWGWIHLGLGAAAVLTGLYLFVSRAVLARVVGIALVCLSMIANFFFLPYYPIWSLAILAIDVFIIWSLATVGSRARGQVDSGASGASAAAVGDEDKWPSTNRPGTRTGVADTSATGSTTTQEQEHTSRM